MECPQSGKKCYSSYQEAFERLSILKIKNSNGVRKGRECRIYKCEFCSWFHLTHTKKFKPKPLPLKTEESVKRAKRILKKGEK